MRDTKFQHSALWGVINITPDSFSDGGLYLSTELAIKRGRELMKEGADVLDVGGASSRPKGKNYGDGFSFVEPKEELARVLPFVEEMSSENIKISVDTNQFLVAEKTLEAGASIINDISMGKDEKILRLVAEHQAEIVLMHNRNQGEVLGDNLHYENLIEDMKKELSKAIEKALSNQISEDKIWIDPGIGFAKNAEQSLEIIGNINSFIGMNYPILVGTSRKSFISNFEESLNLLPSLPQKRIGGSIASALYLSEKGVDALRVHDLQSTKQALILFSYLKNNK